MWERSEGRVSRWFRNSWTVGGAIQRWEKTEGLNGSQQETGSSVTVGKLLNLSEFLCGRSPPHFTMLTRFLQDSGGCVRNADYHRVLANGNTRNSSQESPVGVEGAELELVPKK